MRRQRVQIPDLGCSQADHIYTYNIRYKLNVLQLIVALGDIIVSLERIGARPSRTHQNGSACGLGSASQTCRVKAAAPRAASRRHGLPCFVCVCSRSRLVFI